VQERFERAALHVVGLLRAEFGTELVGLLLGGSVAAGTPLPRSDLDIYVLIRSAWRQRRALSVDGVPVELFINPVAQIRREFHDTEHPSTFAMFATGQALYDPDGAVAQLAEEARRVWTSPRPAVSAEMAQRLRYRLSDLLDDTRDLAEVDDVGAAYLVGITLDAALEAHYRLQRRWAVKPKYVLDDLEKHAPHLVPLVAAAVTKPMRERLAALTSLVDEVLAPVGGTLLAWTTPQEPTTAGPHPP